MNEKEVERLLSLSEAVNTGAVESPIELLGAFLNVGNCPHCKENIQTELRNHPWQVGACPFCNKTIFYVSVPYHACGCMGPLCLPFNSAMDFYFPTEHLGERFVEIFPSKERFSKFRPPKS